MMNKSRWWLAETVIFTGLVVAIWPLDTPHFWSAVVIASLFAFCYYKRREAQDGRVASVYAAPEITPERLSWLQDCARQSREAEDRGKKRCGNSKAPEGYVCTRYLDHDGPCAAWPVYKEKRCEHDVRASDRCYQCESIQDESAQKLAKKYCDEMIKNLRANVAEQKKRN